MTSTVNDEQPPCCVKNTKDFSCRCPECLNVEREKMKTKEAQEERKNKAITNN